MAIGAVGAKLVGERAMKKGRVGGPVKGNGGGKVKSGGFTVKNE